MVARPRAEDSPTILLRAAAFLVDTLSMALILMLPTTLGSYIVGWIGGSIGSIALVWYSALLIFMTGILIRDGFGRSPGKRMLGLRLDTRSGHRCTIFRSIVRNLPLLIPVWNFLELYLVLFGTDSIRTGDRIAGTLVREE